MGSDILRKSLVLIMMLASITGFGYLLCSKRNFKLELNGLNRISEAEIQAKLSSFDLNNRSVFGLNSLKISKTLLESPLIKSAKTKIKLLPESTISIYIEEAKLWALYGEAILDDKTQVMIESRNQALNLDSIAVNKLYEDSYQGRSSLVELMSHKSLSQEELETIKKSSDLINENISIIAHNITNGSSLSPIRMIRVNKINNVFFYSNNLKFAAGVLNKDLNTRVARLNTVVPKMIELNEKQELAYVDLSLNTDEVILGK